MDRDFHNDDFERLLREKSNEFRMYPTKRVWNSIYNNVHPGRKWPSVAMSITLISTLLLVGYLNTRNAIAPFDSTNTGIGEKLISKTISPLITAPFSLPNTQHPVTIPEVLENKETSTVPNTWFKRGLKNNDQIVASTSHQPTLNTKSHPVRNDIFEPAEDYSNTSNTTNSQTIPPGYGVNSLKRSPIEVNDLNDYQTVVDGEETGGLTYADKTKEATFISDLPIIDLPNQEIDEKRSLVIQGGNSSIEKNILALNKNEFITAEDKNWIENYALYNRPAAKKWANKLAFQLYATPSVVYRTLENHADFNNTITATPFAISRSSQDLTNSLNQEPGVGLEIGTGLQYSILKNVKLKAGLQFNFTTYNSNAFLNSHPVTTLLTMHDYSANTSYQVSRATPYSNKSGLQAVKLQNKTFQISLPVGMDIKLLGNDNIQWNIGATIQPTYIVGGKAYLISSDRLNYVKESSMLNRWNLNAGFETNITFKAKGITYQVGPQFRTQLFSTNSKTYAVEERLVNYGLKFGISKNIK